MNTILAACDLRKDIFVVSGDAGLGILDEFKERLPDRFLNLGIAEQNMASFAAGLCLTGYKVYVYNIIPFLLFRCYEQVRNDICYQELPVVLVGTGSGITYAPQGVTHYSVEDLGVCRTLPNLAVISPADPIEAEAAARYSLEADGPVYVRLAKSGETHLFADIHMDITQPRLVREGSDVAILFHGSIAGEVLAAAENLAANGISLKLISVPMVQPLNQKALMPMLEGMRHVVVVEEHFEDSGLGSRLLKIYTETDPPWKLHTKGIPDHFIHDVYDQENLRTQFQICARAISDFVNGLLN